MWLCKALPALCALQPWLPSLPFGSAPSSVPTVELVKITHHVCIVPQALPTVTVTERVGVIATPVTHILTVSTGEPVPRPPLDAYYYLPLSAEFSSPAAYLFHSFGHWLLEKQYSPLEILLAFTSILVATLLPCFIGYFTWPSLKRGVSRWKRWMRHWHHGRQDARRIDRILEGQWTGFTIIDCLAPNIGNLPPDYTWREIIVGISTDLLHFVTNFVLSISKFVRVLIATTIARIPRRMRDVAKLIFDLDDLSWTALRSCVVLVVRILKKTFGFLRFMSLIISSIAALGFRACIRKRLLNRVTAEFVGRPQNLTNDAIWSAYSAAVQMTFEDVAMLHMKLQTLQEDSGLLNTNPDVIREKHSVASIHELAMKATGYRTSLIEALTDINYLRTLICSIMNTDHNAKRGKLPYGSDAAHPYHPSQVMFIPEPNPVTGLYYDTNPDTISHDEIITKQAFVMQPNGIDLRKENHRMAFIVAKQMAASPNKSHVFDPFKKDAAIIKANFPGITIAPYKDTSNPFNVSKKRPPPSILKPETRFGRQIEDMALAGQLGQWRNPKEKLKSLSKVRRYLTMGTMGDPAEHRLWPLTPQRQLYGTEPYMAGEAMELVYT